MKKRNIVTIIKVLICLIMGLLIAIYSGIGPVRKAINGLLSFMFSFWYIGVILLLVLILEQLIKLNSKNK